MEMSGQEKVQDNYRFECSDSSSQDYFFKNGFFVLKSAFTPELIKKVYASLSSAYISLKKTAEAKKNHYHLWESSREPKKVLSKLI